jgi:ribosomal protein L16/L10AE
MGKGKGPIYTEVLFIKKGSIIYEFHNIKIQQVTEIFNFIKKHISVSIKLIKKNK